MYLLGFVHGSVVPVYKWDLISRWHAVWCYIGLNVLFLCVEILVAGATGSTHVR